MTPATLHVVREALDLCERLLTSSEDPQLTTRLSHLRTILHELCNTVQTDLVKRYVYVPKKLDPRRFRRPDSAATTSTTSSPIVLKTKLTRRPCGVCNGSKWWQGVVCPFCCEDPAPKR